MLPRLRDGLRRHVRRLRERLIWCSQLFFAPVIDPNGRSSFADLWDGPRYRAARQLLVPRAGAPAPDQTVCDGCRLYTHGSIVTHALRQHRSF